MKPSNKDMQDYFEKNRKEKVHRKEDNENQNPQPSQDKKAKFEENLGIIVFFVIPILMDKTGLYHYNGWIVLLYYLSPFMLVIRYAKYAKYIAEIKG